MDRDAIIVNPFLHPDLVMYPRPGAELVPERLLPTYRQEMRPGAGAYTGTMAHHLGMNVDYLDWVGDDVFGEFTVSELAKLGHGVRHIRRYSGDSMVCVSIADSRSAGGTMIASYPPQWQRGHDDFAELIDDGPASCVLYVYSWFWSFARPALADAPTASLLERARGRDHTIVLDPNWKPEGPPPAHEASQLRQALPHVDVLLPNARDAAQIVGEHSPAETVRRLLDLGPATVVLKNGGDGSYLGCREFDHIVHVPAADVDVRDTTGAGDYFGGAYIAANDSPHAAVAFATAAAGLAISREAHSELPTRDQILEVAEALLERSKEIR